MACRLRDFQIADRLFLIARPIGKIIRMTQTINATREMGLSINMSKLP
jgi:hypothetical protein